MSSCGIKKTKIMSRIYHKKHLRKGPISLPPEAGKSKKEKSKENLYNNLSNEKLANVNDREAGIALESGLINDKRAYDFMYSLTKEKNICISSSYQTPLLSKNP